MDMKHGEHYHVHADSCGHPRIRHNGHIDYIHDGELHNISDSGVVRHHKLEVSDAYPSGCRPLCYQVQLGVVQAGQGTELGKMQSLHIHSEMCGHVAVIHGDHVDYIVEGRLHRPHVTHCDDHGALDVIPE